MPPVKPSNPIDPIRYVLDTDIVTHQQLGNRIVLQHLHQVNLSEVATTVITMYEQLRGRLAEINRNQADVQLQLAYHRLQLTQTYYCSARVLPFDDKAAQVYRMLIAQKLRIGGQDLKVTAIVLAHNAILVTANRRHFDQVPELTIEDWTRL
ncbi:MAG: type II toxin-antitoxin system VapC family toxin [Caldilineaceae bacterium]